MNLEIGLFLGITTVCVLLVWYLYRRSKKTIHLRTQSVNPMMLMVLMILMVMRTYF
jgi:hypothetical protein